MSVIALCRMLLAVVLVTPGRDALAAVQVPSAATSEAHYYKLFAAGVEKTKENRRKIFEEDCGKPVVHEILATRFRNNALPNQALFSDASSVTTVDRAAAAINVAGGEGVKAGVSVTPFAFTEPGPNKLRGGDQPRLATWFRQSLVIRVATLEDLGVRLGAGANIHFAPEIDWSSIWQKSEACRPAFRTPLKPGAESRLDAEVSKALGDDVKEAFTKVCGALLKLLEDQKFAEQVVGDGTKIWQEKIETMAYTCGGGKKDSALVSEVSGLSFKALGANGKNLRAHLLEKQENGTPGDTQYDSALAALGGVIKELGTLANINLPTPPNLLDTDRELRPRYRQAVWETVQGRLGLEAQLDLTEINWGFRPIRKTGGYPSLEREPLGRGRPSGALVKLSGLVKWKRLEATLGLGLGFRDDLDEKRRTIYVPGGSLSIIAASLKPGHHLVVKDGAAKRLNLEKNGEMPAYLVVGVDLALRFMPGRPSYQEQVVDEVKATLFVDFRFTRTVGFRLGLPVKAEMILQEAITTTTGNVPRDAGRRWSVPAFITTVLGF